MNAIIPTETTLKKYGLTEADFIWWLEFQGYVCPICKKTPNPSKKDGKIRFVIDHQHARGWKKLPPEERKKFVRGLCCWFCNRWYLSKGITPEKAQAVHDYLIRFEERNHS